MVLLTCCSSNAPRTTLGQYLIHRGEVSTLDLTSVGTTLEWLYVNTNRLEWLGCLKGRMRGDTVYAVEVAFGSLYMSAPDSVRATCLQDQYYFGTVHPHYGYDGVPPACWPSSVDLHTFHSSPHTAFLVILCGPNAALVVDSKVRVSDR